MMLVSIISGVLYTPYMLYKLGNETYGVWGIIGSILGYATLADLGLSGAVVKYTAEFRSAAEQAKINRLLSTAITCYMIIGLACIGVTLIVSPVVVPLFNIPPALHQIIVLVFILLGINAGINFPLSVISNYILGIGRYDVRNAITLLTTLLNIGLSILFLESGYGLVGITAATILTSVAVFMSMYWFIFKLSGEPIAVSIRAIDRSMIKLIFNYGTSFSVINLTGMISWQSDNIVVGKIIGINGVTPYVLATKVREMLSRLVWAFLSVLIPTFSSIQTLEDRERVHQLYFLALRVVVFATFPLGLLLILKSDVVLSYWVHLRSADANLVLSFLAFAAVIHLPSNVGLVALLGSAQHKGLSKLSVVDALLNLGLSIIFTLFLGVPGAALGTAVTVILTSGIGVPVIACRELEIPVQRHFVVMGKAFLALGIPMLILLVFPLDVASNPVLLLVLLSLYGLTYAIGFLCLALSKEERISISTKILQYVVKPTREYFLSFRKT